MVDSQKAQGGAGGGGGGKPDNEERKAIALETLVIQNEAAERQRTKHDQKILTWTKRSVLVAGAYVVLTALLLAGGVYSAIQASLAVDAANRAAEAATKQSGILNDQTRTMRETLDEMKRSFATERAYVFLNGVKRDHKKPVVDGYRVTVSFKNFGKTPAILHSIVGGECKYYRAPPPAMMVEPGRPVFFPFDMVIAAGDTAGDYPGIVGITADEMKNTRVNIGSIRCIWNLGYTDVRGGGHVAGACLLYEPRVSGFIFCPEEQYHYDN